MGKVYTRDDLKTMQAWPLDRKISVTQTRLLEWYERWEGQIYISFSGGKDSMVLLDLAARMFKGLHAMFIDTGLEFASVRPFLREYIDWANERYGAEIVLDITHTKPFPDIIREYGYPLIKKEIAKDLFYAQRGTEWAILRFDGLNKDGTPSQIYDRYKKYKYLIDAPFKISHKCCVHMKEIPAKRYERKTKRKPVIGLMAEESMRRTIGYLNGGCNSFDVDRPRSTPIAFWTEQDILQYIQQFNLPLCPVYGEISEYCGRLRTTEAQGTGCVFCLFGARADGVTPFVELSKNPKEAKRVDYILRGGEYDESGCWGPNAEGLGMRKVCEYMGYQCDPQDGPIRETGNGQMMLV